MTPAKKAGTAVAHATCGAHSRQNDRPCRNRAGFRTPHLGEGRCFLHGGLNPIKHGRYSAVKREELRELIEQHANDPDPLNLFPELAAMRALFEDYINRFTTFREALFAWHQSFSAQQRVISPDQQISFMACIEELEIQYRESGEEPSDRQEANLVEARAFIQKLTEPVPDGKPRQMLDLADAVVILREIGKLVERIEKIRSDNAISRPDFLRVLSFFGRVVQTHVKDPATLQKIEEEMLSVRL